MRKSLVVMAVFASCLSPRSSTIDAGAQSAPVTTSTPPDASAPVDVVEDTADDCVDEPTGPVIRKGDTVMIAGDSLAVGMTPKFRELAKKMGYVPVDHAKVGSTTSQWSTWIKADLASYRPSLLVVSLGTNDAAGSGIPSEKLYRDFVETASISGALVVWIGPPAIKPERLPRLEDFREAILSAAPIYYDSRRVDIDLVDGIHTSPAGYGRWMEQIWRWMSDANIVAATE